MSENTSSVHREKSLTYIEWPYLPARRSGFLPGFCIFLFIALSLLAVLTFMLGFFVQALSMVVVGLCFYIVGAIVRSLRNIESYLYSLCEHKR